MEGKIARPANQIESATIGNKVQVPARSNGRAGGTR
jgi:hypothetical protein